MKLLMLALALIGPACGASITVCSDGCNYSTAQAALNASHDGDTIILMSGQNLGSLTIPGGRHNLIFKSSQIDSYPRGYRITRNNPALARLTTVSAGDLSFWLTAKAGSSTLTNAPGGAPQAHGLSVGQKVVVGGSRYSAYVCAGVNQPPYTDGACDGTRVGYINIRTNTGLANGNVLYFTGRTLPNPLAQNTPYYVINFVRGGNVANADKFQISTTPGGNPISIPQFNPRGQDLVIESRPLPQAIGTAMYVVSTPTPSTLQLSPTPGGPPTVWTQVPTGYNGSGLSAGFALFTENPVHDLTFDGIEVSPTVDSGVYYPFYVSSSIGDAAGEHYNISILRSWIHGADDQEDFPMATINIAGHNLEIGWNVIEGAYSTANDTQGIGFMSTRNVSIHDNEIKGATEGIMSGGNVPWFALQTNTTGISIYRNYLWKPLKAYTGIVATFVSPTQFQFLARYRGVDCSTVATDPNLGNHCFAYEAQETPGTTTPPSAAVVSRTEWSSTAANSMFTVNGSTAGQRGYIYLLGGVFHMDYNFGGSVSCPSGVTCTHVSAPAFPVLSTRVGIAVVGPGGVFDGSFYQQNRNVWSKNLLESKYGDNWLVEGNVFHRQSNCDGGSTCQDPAINFTVGATGSAPGDPVNNTASSSNSIIRNNIFRMLSGGIVGVGKSFAVNAGGTGLIWEWAGFGQSINNQVVNNLFMDLGSTEYSALFGGAVVRHQDTDGWLVEHNTAIDVRIGFLADSDQRATYRSNVLTPYRSACPGGAGSCSSPAATSDIGVQNQPGPGPYPYFGGSSANSWSGALANGNVDSTSTFLNNLIMNRAGFVYTTTRGTNYPNTTWLVQPNDAGRDPKALFAAWKERDNAAPPDGLLYRAANYRLAPGQAALYPAFDTKAIGADIDEIEALTGRAGIDVERGWPTFAERTARTIATGGTSIVLSYMPNGSACTIQIWPNPAYNGKPTINTSDSAAETLGGLTVVKLSGLNRGTPYYGKRWCGDEVDVFALTTLAASPELPISLPARAGAASCVIEYGATPALGSTTTAEPVTGGTCSVIVPASAAYWRHSYRSTAGTVVGQTAIQSRDLNLG